MKSRIHVDSTSASEVSRFYNQWVNALTKPDPEWVEQSESIIRGKTVDGEAVEVSIISAKCSACGNYSEQVNRFPPYMKYEYCPHCGRRIL